jgi:hypothetical protein
LDGNSSALKNTKLTNHLNDVLKGSHLNHEDPSDPDKENKNKNRFISALKSFLKDNKGDLIYNQIFQQLPSNLHDQVSQVKEYEDELVFQGYKKQCKSTYIDLTKGARSEASTVDLEIDLMEMILFDPFLGENFIKCLFRYYTYMSQYVKEVFVEIFKERSDSDLLNGSGGPSNFVV